MQLWWPPQNAPGRGQQQRQLKRKHTRLLHYSAVMARTLQRSGGASTPKQQQTGSAAASGITLSLTQPAQLFGRVGAKRQRMEEPLQQQGQAAAAATAAGAGGQEPAAPWVCCNSLAVQEPSSQDRQVPWKKISLTDPGSQAVCLAVGYADRGSCACRLCIINTWHECAAACRPLLCRAVLCGASNAAAAWCCCECGAARWDGPDGQLQQRITAALQTADLDLTNIRQVMGVQRGACSSCIVLRQTDSSSPAWLHPAAPAYGIGLRCDNFPAVSMKVFSWRHCCCCCCWGYCGVCVSGGGTCDGRGREPARCGLDSTGRHAGRGAGRRA